MQKKFSLKHLFHLISQHWFLLSFLLIVFFAACIRLYRLDTLPPSPYWEEVALGYDAYSILKTGKDHHGHPFPLVAFESFGDWKPSLYFYAVVPFEAVLGLSELAVRLPSALAGVLIVVGVAVLMKRLIAENGTHLATEDQTFTPLQRRALPLLAAALTAINPWAIQFSRGAWEVNLATCLLLWGVICMLPATRRFGGNALGAVFLGLSMYTYHAARIVAPLLCAYLLLWRGVHAHVLKTKHEDVSKGKLFSVQKFFSIIAPFVASFLKSLLIPSLIFLAFLLPLLLQLHNPALSQRFAQTSIFSNIDIIKESNRAIVIAGNTTIAKIFSHRYLLFGREILSNFFSHFRLDFLFLSGDTNLRHSTGYMGLFFPFDIVFLFAGLVSMVTHWRKQYWLLVYWLIVGILPSAISYGSPHALRILLTLPVWMMVLSMGVMAVVTNSHHIFHNLGRNLVFHTTGVIIIGLIYLFQLAAFWSYYSHIYPRATGREWWQFGYKEVFQQLTKIRAQYPDKPVFVTREQGRPAMYYWFYNQTDPHLVQQNEPLARHDQGEFLEMVVGDQIQFVDSADQVTGGSILISSPTVATEVLKNNHTLVTLGEVKDLDGETVWLISEVR